MAIEKQKTGLAVVGAGPGGYAAAFRAADLGMKVTLIDPDPNPGGVCLYRGCIPSKALLHVAKVISDVQRAEEWGVKFGAPKIDITKLQTWKEGVVAKLTGGLGQLSRQRKIEYLEGRASLLDPKTLRVLKKGTGEIHLSFDHAILACGARPAPLSEEPPDSPHLLNSTDALNLKEIPQNMLVIGGGYIGLELGTVFATLGTKITLVEMTASLLPGVDRDLILPLSNRLKRIFESIHLETKVISIKKDKKGLMVEMEGGEGKRSSIFEKVLVAIGRKPNSSGLGLEATRVEVDGRGFVKVDGERRTGEPNLFAIGDLTGEPMLAHKASHEARVAVEAISGLKSFFEPRAIPAVVFTDPEIAWCGLTEGAARKENRAVKVVRFPWAASGRAATLGESEGVTKLIVDSNSEQILGIGLSGSGAGELISEGVVAIEMGATASDLKLSIHPHPTLSETLMEAAEVFFGQSVHLYRPKK